LEGTTHLDFIPRRNPTQPLSHHAHSARHRSKPDRKFKMAEVSLFDESFHISSFDPGKYDRVGRIAGTSPDMNTIMTLDINTDLYPISPNENIQFMLASTLNLDGTKDEDMEKGGWRDGRAGASLADQFDYVCYGKVYKFDESADASGAEVM